MMDGMPVVKVVESVTRHEHPVAVWPPGWPVPRLGELIDVGGDVRRVDKVIWFPGGRAGFAPFVAVVVVAS